MRHILALLVVLLVKSLCCHAFIVFPQQAAFSRLVALSREDFVRRSNLFTTSKPQSENDDNDSVIEPTITPPNDDETIVTREMFHKELLKDPVVKRKKNNKGGGSSQQQSYYKVLDNRDSLPFQIEHAIPDPYTHPEVKRKQAHKVRKKAGSIENGLLSSLYTTSSSNNNDNDDKQDNKTLLGEYVLDKYTTTGDIIEIGNTQYKVVRHTCQYKYAGGKRFVMVRKILQVKEIGRIQQEEYLYRQWQSSGS